MQQQKARQVIRGEVEVTNDKGVRIAGQWWNYSRYHAVPHPYEDELVEVTVPEGQNWIEGLVVVEDSKGCTVLHQPAPEPLAEQAHRAPQRATAPSSARDAMIARHVALKAAVSYCAAREQATTEHILPLASRLEAWLTRPLTGESEAAG
ncbi:MAG TPA: hypothetical protein VII06_33365 [Chloroflexota bacterium]